MNDQLKSLIAATVEAGSRNQISIEEICDWLTEYLEMYQQDVNRFSELAGKPHADVSLTDFDQNRPALFVVALFADDTVTIAAGRGDSSSVRGFLERSFPEDARQIIPELAARFMVANQRVSVSRQEFEGWLRK